MHAGREERVTIVDRDNRIVGEATRSEMRRLGLPHRAAYILVRDSAGSAYVQKRTLTKDVYQGYWDSVSGGVVTAGESYEASAERELAEEMGIRGVPLRPLFDFWFEDGRVWGRAFACEYDGPLTPQAEEVEFVERMQPSEILRRAEGGEPFTPDSLLVVRRWLAMREMFTARLRLRRLEDGDVDWVAKMHQDPEVMRYISFRPPAEARLQVIEWTQHTGPFGFWAIEDRATAERHGWVCLKELDHTQEIEVGYRLRRESWGCGFATEAAERLVRYGFEELGLSRIVAVAREENTASRRVIEKLGMREDGRGVYYGVELLRWRKDSACE